MSFKFLIEDELKNIATVNLDFKRNLGDNFSVHYNITDSVIIPTHDYVYMGVGFVILCLYTSKRLVRLGKKIRQKYKIYRIWYRNEIQDKFSKYKIKERQKKLVEFWRVLDFVPVGKFFSSLLVLAMEVWFVFTLYRLYNVGKAYQLDARTASGVMFKTDQAPKFLEDIAYNKELNTDMKIIYWVILIQILFRI